MSGASRTLLSAEELAAHVARLGAEISADHPDGVVVVGVLKGSLSFLADLVRAITVPCVVDFLALSSYREGETRVRILKDLDTDVTGHDVVLAEHVVDTGLSASYLVGLLTQRRARRVSVCTLLDRPRRRIVPVALRYVGALAPDEFLVGYGLDYAERYRNLPSIEVVDPEELGGDAAIFEARAYRARAARSAPERR